MKKHQYISISVRLACLSHNRQPPPLKGVDELLKKACAPRMAKAFA